MSKINSISHLSKTFFLVFLINLFFFSAHASLNMLPEYLKNLGAPNSYIGFFMNINSIALMIFVVFFGKYSNKIDKKISLLIGFTIFIVSMILMFIFSNNLTLLLIIKFFSSVSFAFGFTMHTNIIFDIIPKEKRSSSIALFGISGIMSNPIGSFLGEKVIQYLDYKYLFLLGAFFMLLSMSLVLVFKEEHHHHKDKPSLSFWKIVFDKKIIPLLLTAVFFGGIYGVLVSFVPLLTKERLGISVLSIFFIPFSVVAIVPRLFLSHFLDNFPKKHILQIGFTFALFSLVLLLFLKTKTILFVTGILYGLGHSLMFPTFSSEFVNMGKDEEKIIRSNTYITANTFGIIFISTLFGYIGDIFKTETIFLFTIGTTIATIVICFFIANTKINQN